MPGEQKWGMNSTALLCGITVGCCLFAGLNSWGAPAPEIPVRQPDALSEEEFRDPPVSARPGAFWPWLNGHVSLPRITFELEEMKSKGMSGADIWDVRSIRDPDNQVPTGPAFLEAESLDAIAHALSEADRLGLRLGMIAASGWNAGGPWVTPQDAGMGLFHSETRVKGPGPVQQDLPFPEVSATCPKDAAGRPVYWREVAVLAIPAGGSTSPVAVRDVRDLRQHLDSAGRLTWTAPSGEWVVLRFIMANTGHQLIVPSPNSGGPMIDFLNPESTRRHFQHIVDRLKSRVGDLSRSPLKYLEVDSMELGEEQAWTGRILREFRNRHDYDPIPYLPVLTGLTVADRDTSQRFLHDWRGTISDVFIESHYQGARRLLNRNGLQLCAEAGGPGAPIWASCPVEALKALGSVDVLRGEFWPKHRNMWLVKEISSAAHIYGKRIVDAESFTSWRHWQDGPYYLKQLADNALGEGLNHFTFHTFTHSPAEAGLPGNAYHAGTHINPNVAWWPMARPFIDYLSRCSLLLQKGRFVADVCFYYGDEAPNFVPSKHVGFSPGAGYDYDVVNSEVILKRFKVRDHRLVLPDGMSYGLLLLPERNDMDLDVLRRLEQLVREGATVVGPKPTRTGTLDGFPKRDRQVAALADRLWGKCDGTTVLENPYGKGRIIWNRPLPEVFAGMGLTQDFSFKGMDGRTRLDYLHRNTGSVDIYYVNNRNERWEDVECLFRVQGGHPQLWNPETGEVRDLPLYEQTPPGIRVPLHLAPAQAAFVVFRPATPATHWTRIEPGPSLAAPTLPTLLPHTATPGGPMWLSDDRKDAAGQFITFDLGTPQPLRNLRVWNYNENVRGYINFGIKDLEILLSLDGSEFKKLGAFTLRDGGENEDRDYWQDLPLDNARARYVRLEVKSNQNRPSYSEGMSGRAGLSKVEFYGPDKIEGVRVHSVSSGRAFAPETDGILGSLHPAAEIHARPEGGHALRVWQSGSYVLHQIGGAPHQVDPVSIPAPVPVEGAWTVNFPPGRGAPDVCTFEKLVSWTERPEPGIRHFSGIATYHKTLDLPASAFAPEARLELDLGALQHVSRITLNGKPLGILWKPPYCLDITAMVRPGPNELAIEIANTWNNRLIGDGTLPREQQVTRSNLQKDFANPSKHLQTSGLLGPVRVVFSKDVLIQ